MSGQQITEHVAEFDEGYWFIRCNAPAHAPCRARFTCGCESYEGFEVHDGRPVHLAYDSDRDVDRWHVGSFSSNWCNIDEWFTEGDGAESLTGVRVPIEAEWQGDHYTFSVAQGGGVS